MCAWKGIGESVCPKGEIAEGSGIAYRCVASIGESMCPSSMCVCMCAAFKVLLMCLLVSRVCVCVYVSSVPIFGVDMHNIVYCGCVKIIHGCSFRASSAQPQSVSKAVQYVRWWTQSAYKQAVSAVQYVR